MFFGVGRLELCRIRLGESPYTVGILSCIRGERVNCLITLPSLIDSTLQETLQVLLAKEGGPARILLPNRQLSDRAISLPLSPDHSA
jgi:uncharacterized protein YbbC (DUF1343 family)